MSRLFWISKVHLLKSYKVSDAGRIPKIIQNLRGQNDPICRLCRMLLLWPLHGTQLHQPEGVIAMGEQGAKVQDEEVYLIYLFMEFIPVFPWIFSNFLDGYDDCGFGLTSSFNASLWCVAGRLWKAIIGWHLNTFKIIQTWLSLAKGHHKPSSLRISWTMLNRWQRKTKDWMNARDMMKCGDLCEPVLILWPLCIVTRNRRESTAAAWGQFQLPKGIEEHESSSAISI